MPQTALNETMRQVDCVPEFETVFAQFHILTIIVYAA